LAVREIKESSKEFGNFVGERGLGARKKKPWTGVKKGLPSAPQENVKRKSDLQAHY